MHISVSESEHITCDGRNCDEVLLCEPLNADQHANHQR